MSHKFEKKFAGAWPNPTPGGCRLCGLPKSVHLLGDLRYRVLGWRWVQMILSKLGWDVWRARDIQTGAKTAAIVRKP